MVEIQRASPNAADPATQDPRHIPEEPRLRLIGWEEAEARLGGGCGEAGRRLGGGWEEAARRLGGAQEEAGRRLAGGWEEAGSRLGGAWEEPGRSLGGAWEQAGEGAGRRLSRGPEELFTTTLPSLAPHGLLRSPEELKTCSFFGPVGSHHQKTMRILTFWTEKCQKPIIKCQILGGRTQKR